MKKRVVVCPENCKSKNVLFSDNITKRIKNRMFEKINNVNVRFLVLSVYKVQNRQQLKIHVLESRRFLQLNVDYDKARSYLNSRGCVLWPKQWKDLTVKVVL